MKNRLTQLMGKYQRGNRPAFNSGPFLPITAIRDGGFAFNDVFRDVRTMTAAARMGFELGFESTVIPFDMNVEAEMLGAGVGYHEGFDGHPVYPTINHRPVVHAEHVILPSHPETQGRMPAVLKTIRSLKRSDSHRGAVGAFMTGPFTLAGQVMEPEQLFMMLLKDPDRAGKILKRLADFINRLKTLYVKAGVDFLVVEEGGAAGVSPRLFGRLLLPHLQTLFAEKPCPMTLSFVGGTEDFLDFLLACDPDGVRVDGKCDLVRVRERVPRDLPLFTGCGVGDILAKGDPETIAGLVHNRLEGGATSVSPPADIYPAAKPENIAAFVEAFRQYPG